MGVAQKCEIMGGAKVQGGETACPPYSWMADMKLREGKKWRHKRCRNRHDRGNPPISKVKILAVTIGKWLEAQRVASLQINSVSAMAAAASLPVSQDKRFFVQGANTAIKMNCTIAGDSATGWKKFTARHWTALIGFCGVETWKQVQNNWKKI